MSILDAKYKLMKVTIFYFEKSYLHNIMHSLFLKYNFMEDTLGKKLE